MKKYFKKVMAVVLSFAIAMAVSLPGSSDTATAAYWKTAYTSKGMVTVTGGQPFEAKFSLKSYGDIRWTTKVQTLYGYTITLYDSTEKELESKYIADADTSWTPEGQVGEMIYIHVDAFKGYNADTYTISVKFDGESELQASFSARTMDTSDSMPVINDQEITAGFKTTLTVKDDTIKKCVSSNKKVASVTSKGVVTGKKKGTAKITVTTEKGKSLTCNVNVKANVYSAEKVTKKDVAGYGVVPYQAKYDAKGNLVVKAVAVNKFPRKVTLRVWPNCFKNMANTGKMASVTIPSNGSKSVTLKFSKASLRKQKVNLPVDGFKLFCMERRKG